MRKIIWWFQGRCLKCGRQKYDWRGTDVCYIHDLTPPAPHLYNDENK